MTKMKKVFLLSLLLMNILALTATTQAPPLTVIPYAPPDQNVYSGQVVTLLGTFYEPYPGAAGKYRWNFGDGSPIEEDWVTGATVETTHIYVGSSGTFFNLTFGIWQNMVVGEWFFDNAIITILGPEADAGPDQTVEATSSSGAEVTLDASASTGYDLAYFWLWTGGSAIGVNPTATFPLGTTTVFLTVTDPGGNTDTDEVDITVVDTTPPVISLTVTPDTLWPPNHKYHTVTATVTLYDLVDATPTVTLVSVTSNEPDNGKGDGNTVDDIVVVDDFTFNLRAERSELGSGRIYTITYRAADSSGNTIEASATITVPI